MESRATAHDAQASHSNPQRGKQKVCRLQRKQSLSIYWLLSALRIALTCIPQTGYIHPDEYFQTIEIVAGDVFDLDIQRPWEFNITFPVRSILLPKLVYGIPYGILYAFTPLLTDTLGWDVRSPYIMLLLPRIVSCLLSFVTDYCLYKICILYGQKYSSRLLILASSYVVIVYGTRTLSNSIEMALTSLLLYLVADSMVLSEKVLYQLEFLNDKYVSASTPTERVKLFKMRAALPPHSLHHCFYIATIAVAGVFNRPTFLAFGFSPVVFWLQRGICFKSSGLRGFHVRIFVFILCAIPALCLFIIADSLYYGYLTWNEVGMGDIGLSNFVVTPFNFFIYNSRESNLAQHGLHPRVTHMLVNIPVLYNVLGLTGILAVCNLLVRASQAKWHELPRIQSIMMLMTASILVPVIALSLVPHQEARFLIPITLPLVFLHAQEIRDMDSPPSIMYKKQESIQTIKQHSTKPPSLKKRKGKSLINLWIVLNCLLALFFGFLHQGGIYPLTSHMKKILQTQTKLKIVHLVTSNMYPIPHSLLVQRNSNRQYFNPKTKTRYSVTRKFYTYELGSKSMTDVVSNLKEIINEGDLRKKSDNLDYQVYLALPSTLLDELLNSVVGSNLTIKTEEVFYPHLSTEAMPRFSQKQTLKRSQASPCCGGQSEVKNFDFTFSEFEDMDEQFCPHRENDEASEISFFQQAYNILNQLGLTLLLVEK